MDSVSFSMNYYDMLVAEEAGMRGIKKDVWGPLHKDINAALKKAKNTKDSKESIDGLEELLPLIDNTINELKAMKPDEIDVAIDAGSRVVSLIISILSAKSIFLSAPVALLSSPIRAVEFVSLNILKSIAFKKLTVADKVKTRDKCVKDLQSSKEMIQKKISELKKSSVQESFLSVATEGARLKAVGDKIRKGISDLITLVKKIILRITNWLHSKLYKVLKIKTIRMKESQYLELKSAINHIAKTSPKMREYFTIVSSCTTVMSKVKKAKSKEEIQGLVSDQTKTLEPIETKIREDIEEFKKIQSKDYSNDTRYVNIPARDLEAVPKWIEFINKINTAIVQKLETIQKENSEFMDAQNKQLIELGEEPFDYSDLSAIMSSVINVFSLLARNNNMKASAIRELIDSVSMSDVDNEEE